MIHLFSLFLSYDDLANNFLVQSDKEKVSVIIAAFNQLAIDGKRGTKGSSKNKYLKEESNM